MKLRKASDILEPCVLSSMKHLCNELSQFQANEKRIQNPVKNGGFCEDS